MSHLGRALGWLFPSVPPRDQAIVLAAMEGRTITPISVSGGEAGTGTGTATAPTFHGAVGTPEGGVAPATEPATSTPAGAVQRTTPRPPVTTPFPSEVLLWSPHPHHSWEFTDAALAQLVTDWQKEPHA